MTDTQAEQTQKKDKVDFTRRLTKIILAISLLYFIWYLVGDRITPTTSQARVRAVVIPMVPQVAGKISQVHIGGDKQVKEGDVLFEIDPRDYQYAVDQAKGNLELAGQDVGASTANVAAAKASLAKAQADFEAKEINANRIISLKDKGIVTDAEVDQARGVVSVAAEQVNNAKAAYEQAKQQLGKEGQSNPKVQNALAALSDAQLDLERTKIRAPGNGVISYAKINVGFYAATGSKIMTFISSDYVWIEAAYRENNLGNLKAGDPVDIILDASPGNIYKGSVVSIGYGVSFDKSVQGELPTPEQSTGWMREPQRFTVIMKFEETIPKGLLREGGQADVITYTGDNFIFNSLGKVWAWITSILTFIY